jgi:polyisoprenyl-teichoic acid--peptidoglycan teichoic acid transferase
MDPTVVTPSAQAGPPTSEHRSLDSRIAAGGDGHDGPPGGYLPPDALAPPPRRRYVWRAVLGCLIVLLASAGAAAVAVLEQVHTIVQDISVNQPLKVSSRALAQSSFGRPETLLLIGDDTRSVFKYYNAYVPNLANEMLLVRIDPSKPFISMMSLPRELWVNVTEPDGLTYTNRLNSAYTYGTTTLLQTIKQVTGLSVNHVIATTFTQFENAINTLGCVYDTIDERYYNLNDGAPGTDYQSVNLEPGYQCLNGSEAEQFVSYRHTDTSQVRDARDQSLLLSVKQQYGPHLSGNLGEFERVFGKTVQTDPGLRSPSEILNLANLLVSAEGLRVRQVAFPTLPCTDTCPSADLTATPQQIQNSVHNFLFGGDTTPTGQIAAISHQIGGRGGLAHLPLTATVASNAAAEQATAAKLQFTAEFPKVQDLAGSATPVAPQCTQFVQACIRKYLIHAPNGKAYPIYVEVFSNGDLGQFYDVQGTTWTGAPLFAHPNQTVRVGKRTYDLFYDGSHLEMIAWREYGAVYWVHNTLTDAVGNGELLAIAEQTEPVGAVRTAPTHVILKAFSVPTHHPPTVATPVVESVGRVGGLVTLVLLPLGLLLVFRNWRRLRALRDGVAAAAATAAVLEAQLASAAVGYRPMVAPGAVGHGTEPPGDVRFAGAAAVQFERYRSRRRWIPVGLGLGLVLVATAGYVALHSNTLVRKPKPRPQPVLSAPVAVLNAGEVADAAHRLALELTRQHAHVVGIGNLGAAPPVSYEVLYTPGDLGQARLLAGILKAQHPLVAQIDATTVHAIGSKPRLVVVIP